MVPAREMQVLAGCTTQQKPLRILIAKVGEQKLFNLKLGSRYGPAGMVPAVEI